MFPQRQHDSRVVYVAGSAREFPEPVREWLSQADHRAVASPNLYDALARLTGRRRPVALIVSIESVDWEEIEFFDLAARLSRETTLYVAGHEHHRAKIEAALSRGARPFSAEELAQDLSRPAPGPRPPTTRDLFAGTLQTVPERAGRPPIAGFGSDSGEPATCAPTLPAQSPIARPAQAKQPGQDRMGSTEGPIEERATPPPSVRLVTPSETEADLEPTADNEPPIPFPWTPSLDRPSRTPPAAAGKPATPAHDAQEARAKSGTEAPGLQSGPSASHPAPPSVELTPEELAALMGKPVQPRSASGQEHRL